MLPHYPEIIKDTSAAMAKLRADIPDTLKGFTAMAQAATKDGAIDAKTKELIALAIGVTQKCSGCIGFHVQALHKLGATRAELDEMLGLCVYMGGGPALMYCAEAIDAWEKLTVKTA